MDSNDVYRSHKNRQKPIRVTTRPIAARERTRNRSKKCKKHPANLVTNTAPVPAVTVPIATESTQIQQDNVGLDPADDIDAYDALPFDTELPGMECEEQDEFHDCGTWSEDEDGILATSAIL